MTFKPALWRPIAALLSLANLAAVGFAAGAAEPMHATVHAGLTLAFGVWAYRLRRGANTDELDTGELPARLEALENEASQLRLELNELQERLDFAERLLAQPPETRRMGPER